MASNSPQLQLESLFVGIYANLEPFTNKIPEINKAVDEVASYMATMFAKASSISGQAIVGFAQTATTAIAQLGGVINSFVGQILASMGSVQAQFVTFGSALSGIAAGGISEAALALSRIGNFLNAVSATTSFKKIGAIVAPLQTFVQGFKDSIAGLVTAQVDLAAKALGKIGSFANSITKMNIDNVQIGNLNTALSGIFSTLQTGGTAAVGVAGEAIGRLGRGLSSLSKADPIAITALGAPLTNLLTALGSAPIAVLTPVTTALGSLGRSLKAITAINPAQLLAVGNAIKAFLLALASVPIPPNLPKIAQLLTQISSAAKGASNAIGGISGGIPPVKNVSAAVSGVGGAAEAAGNRVGWFSGRLNNMATAAGSANVRLNTLKLTLAGFAGYGLSLFAKFDDSVTKMMAHAGIFPEDTKGKPNTEFEGTRASIVKALMDVSSGSIFGATALAKALDTLTVSGQSAGMAIESLKITETFATASSMDLEAATKKLVDLQRSIGNERIIGKGSGDEVQDYYKSIAKLGDLLVGVSRQVGSTEEQMTKAFTGHFYNAMQRANLNIEQSLALLGVYSQASADFRGSGGGDAVSRMVNALMNKGTQEIVPWQQITSEFGGIFNKQGKLKPIDVVSDILGKVLGTEGTQAQTAKMDILKIAERRTQDALLPFIGKGDELRKQMNLMKEYGDIQKVVADMIRRDFLSQMKILWNNVSNAGTVIGTHLAPAIGILGKGIESLTKAFTNLNPALQNLIVWGTAFTLLLRPMIGLVTRLISTFIVGPIMAVGGAIWNMVAGLGTFAVYTYKALGSLGSTMWTVFSIPYKLLSGVGGMLKSIVALFAGIIPFFINLAMWLVFIVPLIALIGTVIATVFIGVVQLFGAIASSVVTVWDSIKEGAGKFAVGVVDSMVSAGHSVAGMWERSKPGAVKFLESIANGLKLIAGFLWNFEHNFEAVMEWLGKNWNQLAEDMGDNFRIMIDNLIHNIKALGSLIYDILSPIWNQLWRSAGSYTMVIFNWLKANWSDILGDMALLFRTFVRNLAENFVVVFHATKQLASAILFGKTEPQAKKEIEEWGEQEPENRNSRAWRHWKTVLQEMQKEIAAIRKGKAAIITGMISELKGPFEGLDTSALTTNFTGLKMGLAGANFGTQKGFANAWEAINKRTQEVPERTITGSTPGLGLPMQFTIPGQFKSLFEGFMDTTAPLLHLLKLDLPKDPAKLIESLKAGFGLGGGRGDEAGDVSGKQHPGFAFKQISLARTMLGGEAAMQLDFQQLVTLRLIASKLDQMIELAKGKQIYTGPSREDMPTQLGTGEFDMKLAD